MEQWCLKILRQHGLGNWTFTFKTRKTLKEYASVQIDPSGFLAEMSFGPRFFSSDLDTQVWCLLHEACHCHFARFSESVDVLVQTHVAPAGRGCIADMLSVVEEAAIDGLSKAMAFQYLTNARKS